MAVNGIRAGLFLRHCLYYQSKCLTPVLVGRSLGRFYLLPCSQQTVQSNFISTSVALYKDKPKAKSKIHKADDKELGNYVDVDRLRSQLNNEVEKLKQFFVQQLSIRSSVGLVETMKISFEGKTYELQELAQVAKKGKHIMAINMAGFPQASVIVMKALKSSSLGLNPSQDGTLITVQLPRVTKEHRENLSKQAKAAFFDCKKAMDRLIDANNKEAKKNNLSKDEVLRVNSLLRLVEEEYLHLAESALKIKQDELKLEE